jgi:hypothetical protein
MAELTVNPLFYGMVVVNNGKRPALPMVNAGRNL